jgi:hypothetical protein
MLCVEADERSPQTIVRIPGAVVEWWGSKWEEIKEHRKENNIRQV